MNLTDIKTIANNANNSGSNGFDGDNEENEDTNGDYVNGGKSLGAVHKLRLQEEGG